MSVFKFPGTVWLLAAIQAMGMTTGTLMVLVAGIFGASVAPEEKLATLPLALMIIGTAAGVSPMTLLSQKIGRKKVFLLAAMIGVFASLLAAFAVSQNSFWIFCISAATLGIAISGFQQIRFAAIELVDMAQAPKVISLILVGGLFAAIIGPELSTLGQKITPESFQGTFYLLASCQFLCLLGFVFYQPRQAQVHEDSQQQETRSTFSMLKSPALLIAIASASIGYAVMAFIMTATPVHMHVFEHHSLEQTKVVIQSHIVAMFLPSFISGWLIMKFGELKLILTGVIIFLVCIAIGFIASDYNHFWIALILLGIAWNFLFTAGTSLLPKAYEPHERFKAQAVNDGVMFASQAIASLSAGAVLIFAWLANHDVILSANFGLVTINYVVVASLPSSFTQSNPKGCIRCRK